MKLKPFILLAFTLLTANTFAQIDPKVEATERPVYKSKVPIWLNSSVGINLADCYDNGTIPFSYMGMGVNFNLGATIEWRRCHIQTETRLMGNFLTEFEGYAIGIDNRLEFLYRFHGASHDRWRFWAGGSLQGFMDVKEIPALMNAAVGVTAFENLCATSMAQFDFAFIRGGAMPLFSAYAKLSLPIVGLAVRPGFTYLDNYTGDINMANTVLGDYESFGKLFPGVSTDIGLYFNLLNGNRIGLGYRWDYLSTGHKGIYRYDNAFHAINLNFMFRIN